MFAMRSFALKRSMHSIAQALASVLALALVVAPGRAEVEPAVRELVAVRGEPLLVDVRVGVDASIGSIELSSRDGMTRIAVAGRLFWPYLPAPTPQADGGSLVRWAAATNPLRLAEARPIGATSAFLVVDIPSTAADSSILLIGSGAVDLNVFAPGPATLFDALAARAGMIAPQGPRNDALSLPDPRAPFERFRYAIGVPMRGWPEPAPFRQNSGDDLAARANTAIWRAALARTMAGGVGPATELAELLVATCSDTTAPAPIAAWIADPEELRSVLKLALEREFSSARLAASVNEFVRVRGHALWWIEDSDRTSVTLAVANPTMRAQLVQYQWIAGNETDVLPLALEIPCAEVRRTRIARATTVRNPLAVDEPGALEQLRVSCAGIAENLTVPPAVLPVRGGGLDIIECYAPLNLVSVSLGQRAAAQVLLQTHIAVRERLAGWEIYLEARGIEPPLSAVDAILVRGATPGFVRVDATGAVVVESCELQVDSIEFGSFPGQLRASFFIPPDWISREDDATIVEVGFRRSFPGGFADAPFPTVPWRARPRTIAIDLATRK